MTVIYPRQLCAIDISEMGDAAEEMRIGHSVDDQQVVIIMLCDDDGMGIAHYAMPREDLLEILRVISSAGFERTGMT